MCAEALAFARRTLAHGLLALPLFLHDFVFDDIAVAVALNLLPSANSFDAIGFVAVAPSRNM